MQEALARVEGPLVEGKTPRPGDAANSGYDGNGYTQSRHPQTAVVEEALQLLLNTVRVEMEG